MAGQSWSASDLDIKTLRMNEHRENHSPIPIGQKRIALSSLDFKTLIVCPHEKEDLHSTIIDTQNHQYTMCHWNALCFAGGMILVCDQPNGILIPVLLQDQRIELNHVIQLPMGADEMVTNALVYFYHENQGYIYVVSNAQMYLIYNRY